MKVLVIGAVKSTERTIDSLLKYNFDIVGILGHKPKKVERVSGWVDLRDIAALNEIDFKYFTKINEYENLEWAKSKKPDIIFAVGFSQLLLNIWFSIPVMGVIGFHPTVLPRGRGRAPIAWLVLEEDEGAATFFLMGDGADDGPIFVQKNFTVNDNDCASTIEQKILVNIDYALDEWLPELKRGIWSPKKQNEKLATWYGKRGPDDGLVNWLWSATEINKIIKASSNPHPGAYTYFNNNKIVINECNIEENLPIKGVVGRILLKDHRGLLIQCGTGLLWLYNIYNQDKIKVGDKLGYSIEDEIFKIWQTIDKLKNE